MAAAATVSAFASAVAAADADDANVDIAHAARPGSATLPPICERRSCGLLRAGRSSGSRTHQRHRHRRRSPDCRSAQPADECGWSTRVYECGWSYYQTNLCLASPDGPACAVAPVAAVRTKISLQHDRKDLV